MGMKDSTNFCFIPYLCRTSFKVNGRLLLSLVGFGSNLERTLLLEVIETYNKSMNFVNTSFIDRCFLCM